MTTTHNLGELQNYQFVVTFVKYQDRWLYSRHKNRDTWETAGGHIEPGETPIEAARRELYEETGAADFDIYPAFDYSVHMDTGISNGQVFFAEVRRLESLPPEESEMAEVRLFDTIPDKMTYPQILPALYARMQPWLNLRSSADELWDVYDKDRQLTGRLHRRGDPLPPGDYHLVVDILIQNNDGKFLVTKRSPNKGFANMWEYTSGSAIAGDDSLTAALREVKEETGLDLSPDAGKRVFTVYGHEFFLDIWLFRHDFNLTDVVLQTGETCDAKIVSQDDIRTMIEAGEFIPAPFIEGLFAMINADAV
ncbi:MAG: NUDIX domain-containing protein [Oscillospiraceae bacterium]|nr:NUDIX domain-containing protein [Oscillospiraceae bacterium]